MYMCEGVCGMQRVYMCVVCACVSVVYTFLELCRVEELQHQLAHQCSPNIIGILEWGICGLMGGAFIT